MLHFSSIMRLSNELIYSGALECANNAVSQARLVVTPSEASVSIQVVLIGKFFFYIL